VRKGLHGKVVAVCLHPAVDHTYEVPHLDKGEVVQGRRVTAEAAGKGVNVARTLALLGCPVFATGFLGETEEGFYKAFFDQSGIDARFVPVAAQTRQNLTLVETSTGRDLHVLDTPMRVRRDHVARFGALLRRRVTSRDWVAFCGSCPKGVRQSDFSGFLRLCGKLGARVIVDTSGGMLKAAMRTRPWLIKPNVEELAQLVGELPATRAAMLSAARSLLGKCGQVLVSLGRDGAILVTPEGTWHAVERGRADVVHTVGCGDALLAGFLAASASGEVAAEALRTAVACGSACVRTAQATIGSRRDMMRLLGRVALRRL